MTKKNLIDSRKLKHDLYNYLLTNYYSYFRAGFDRKARQTWSETAKQIYHNEYSNLYNQMRKEAAETKRKRWLTLAGEENFKAVLEDMGLTIRRDGIRAMDSGRKLFRYYLENVVIPRIEKEFNITGIKIPNNISPLSYQSCLNFEEVELIETDKPA